MFFKLHKGTKVHITYSLSTTRELCLRKEVILTKVTFSKRLAHCFL